MSPTMPTLRTKRLLLRPPCMEDLAAYTQFMCSPRSIHMGGPLDLRGAWLSFCHDVALWPLYGHGALMIDGLADSTCIGQVGVNHGPLFPEKELGWLLYEGFEGQGYASEAAAALRDWAFRALKLPTLVSYCDRANTRSQAVARRLGGVLDEAAPRQDPEDVVFRYPPQL